MHLASQVDLTPRQRCPRSSWTHCRRVTLLAALVPAVMWPGDTPWMNDEPAQIAKGFTPTRPAPRVAAQRVALRIHYGPLPTRIYQALLLSHCTTDQARGPAGDAPLRVEYGASPLWLTARSASTRGFRRASSSPPSSGLDPRALGRQLCLPHRLTALARSVVPADEVPLAVPPRAAARPSHWPVIHFQELPLAASLSGHMLWRHRPDLRRELGGVLASSR